MKALIASLAALGLIATPALAQTKSSSTSGSKKTETMVTKGPKATATTTVTTKVTPNKSTKHASAKHHAKHHATKHAMAHKTTKTTKTATPAKKAG